MQLHLPTHVNTSFAYMRQKPKTIAAIAILVALTIVSIAIALFNKLFYSPSLNRSMANRMLQPQGHLRAPIELSEQIVQAGPLGAIPKSRKTHTSPTSSDRSTTSSEDRQIRRRSNRNRYHDSIKIKQREWAANTADKAFALDLCCNVTDPSKATAITCEGASSLIYESLASILPTLDKSQIKTLNFNGNIDENGLLNLLNIPGMRELPIEKIEFRYNKIMNKIPADLLKPFKDTLEILICHSSDIIEPFDSSDFKNLKTVDLGLRAIEELLPEERRFSEG